MGIYHPAQFNDRLVLGLKGTMSEAELHILRARLDGGIRNKAARGELRRGLPVGLVWGEEDGEVRFHPDEAVTAAIRTVFERFDEFGSVRRVWLWFRSEGLNFPLQSIQLRDIQWIAPTYHAIHSVLTSPVYAGAYVYGKTRHERYVDEQRTGEKTCPKTPTVRVECAHPRITMKAISTGRPMKPIKPALPATPTRQPHQGGGAVREGSALLQGLATCGHCGRRLRTHYRGRNHTPGYHCAGKNIVDGRGEYCLNVGGVQIDQAAADAFLEALTPAGVKAALAAAEQLEANHDAALEQWRLALERARYEAQRAERRYRAVEPENRLVARGLEAEWEQRLRELEQAQAELTRRETQRPKTLTADERHAILALRNRSQTRVERTHNDISRPKGIASHAAGGSHHIGLSRRHTVPT